VAEPVDIILSGRATHAPAPNILLQLDHHVVTYFTVFLYLQEGSWVLPFQGVKEA
jgi:hypothetical protein